MGKMFYCIRCKDKTTGKEGSFLHEGDFVAVSPIFKDVADLFVWLELNKYERVSHKSLTSLEVVKK
jgi:hypothetical protein